MFSICYNSWFYFKNIVKDLQEISKIAASIHKIISKHDGVLHCINCLHSFGTENKLKKHENICKNHD